MPNMLGKPQDWFFPPLPEAGSDSRSAGYTVERGSWLNKPADWDKANRGYFQWEVKTVSATSSRLKLRETRSFRTDDRSQELVGSGEFEFDLTSGLMTNRSFAATYTLHGKQTRMSLNVTRLSEQQILDLQR
jgi:hypothetical protein